MVATRETGDSLRPLRGLANFYVAFSWGLRPRLYACTCSAGYVQRGQCS